MRKEDKVPYFCARTKPNQEKLAQQNLKNQGIKTFLPMILEKGKIVPLFRSYIFIEKPPSGQWRFITNTKGIRSMVFTGNEPATIKKFYLRELMRECGRKGYMIPPELVPDESAKKRKINIGESVRIKHGSFVSQIGIYQGQSTEGRERVLMKFFNRESELLLSPEYLKPLNEEEW